jgi:hypothetical protein
VSVAVGMPSLWGSLGMVAMECTALVVGSRWLHRSWLHRRRHLSAEVKRTRHYQRDVQAQVEVPVSRIARQSLRQVEEILRWKYPLIVGVGRSRSEHADWLVTGQCRLEGQSREILYLSEPLLLHLMGG